MPPERDAVSLVDIARATELVLDFKEGMSKDQFMRDQKTQSAVLHQLLIIGEAVKRLSNETRHQHTTVPWGVMAGMRDTLIPGYDNVDMDEVGKTISDDLPMLLETLQPLLPPSEDH